MRAALVLAGLAVAAAVAGALYLLLADTYTSTSCSADASGLQRCTGQTGQTLAEVNGNGVLWLLAVPIAATTATWGMIALSAPKPAEGALALLLLFTCFLTGLTIGMFFFPGALLATAAVALDRRPGEPAARALADSPLAMLECPLYRRCHVSSAAVPVHAEIPPPAIQEVSDGIYAYIQLDGSWFLNNTGCVVGRDTVTVVDATGTEARARAWHAALRQVTPKPVSALINTHSHGDHTHGNFMFADSAIIASELCRREIIASGTRAHALFPMVDFGKCPVTPPTVTFEDRLSVYVDDLRIELIFVGPAHTTNDIVAWLPDRKLLFSGDIIFNGGTPFALGGSVGGWLQALDVIEALGAETIVPGHGPVAGPSVIGDVREYLQFVQETAKRGMEAGTPPLEFAQSLDLGKFDSLHDKERLVPNLHRAYSELRGERWGKALDYQQLFAEMLIYNGNQPLRCLA